ncbi:lovastatin nonaketide synthase [Pyrenophora tritici-repentis Pt-1C-BFP]|uniref:Lovastatin nonaketide synthase n=1 Tax=Pyrenophora tritici-repentis (strain Pt-1C-BFP) TaxID=426418 RepID=B2WPW4_PYRTR|nr:lovastatin nonaketide synthase [Pyrenophora tritici-repentis Pt-1C-BFP]EDU46180.1 lovastatin nonaketide synthase [Pyrenophora tritici-repentis Pt-1C-BFP]
MVSYVSESKLKMLSPTGRSRMWDAEADGYARGEGICSVVLKTLSQALKDGDTIECIIRETGVNQDGRTTGITMPSHLSQETLIRETYAKAGLDISNPEDRCQFFEAHGTGTPAGDPQEAEAISSAFFAGAELSDEEPLAVGSVKTIIGHTEGTAGLAGLLKASLAVQHGVIPPNMLFENLNPRIAPFYQNLRILREPQSWPAIKPGLPRRASVNSFGFGGTNAHIIVEEYKPSEKENQHMISDNDSTFGLPIVFSAKTEKSLKKLMESMLDHINENPSLDVLDLVSTLLHNQSVLPLRYSISGHTKESITAALSVAAREFKVTTGNDSKTTSGDKASILGIFTGQGAQYPGMMKGLLSTLPYVQEIVADLDHSLQALPSEYRPSWTLHDQFLLEEDSSNVLQAAYSQPLCCATQIVLVQMLAAADIKFTTVVGHSSGEIACAYATGLISASQAIRVAYLRGLASQFAGLDRGEGAMMAAGISFEDAQELCELEAFEGCICVAASNAPDSTTIAGDKESILQVQDILADESKFSRVLRVDKAYHSHHMQPCATPYKDALVACGCAVADGIPETAVAWYSSVHTGTKMSANNVTADYWTENLLNPVMFMQALEEAAMVHQPNVAVEVGCHPALKAPALSTLKGIGFDDFPYTGCMRREEADLAAFAEALGYLWQRFTILEPADVETYISTVCGKKPRNISKLLPMYPWDHSKVYWSESRTVKNFLHGPRPHLLLGSPTAFSTSSVLQWRNMFRVKDHDWMQGHGLQGQALFPAAGFIIMAMEAGIIAAENRPVQLVEVFNTSIDKAIIFEDETSAAEVVTTAKVLAESSNATRITLGFTIDSCLSKEANLSTSAQGRVVVTLGLPSPSVLPSVSADHPHMNDLDIDYFYRELDALGYCYEGSYRCISEMRRADGKSVGTLPNFRLNDGPDPLLLHPATLDLSFQTIMGAYSHPGDKRLRSLYVPVHVDRIAVAPEVSKTAPIASNKLHFSTTNTYDKGDFFAGCVDTTDDSADGIPIFSVENLVLKPLSPPTASEDHRAFTTTFWGPFLPDKLLDDPELWATEEDKRIMPIIERIVYSYIKKFLADLTAEDRANATAPQKSYIHWYDNVMADVAAKRHRWYEKAWENDTPEYIERLCQDRLSTGPGWGYGKQIVGQIAHRFQSMDILEVGGGTAGATRSILSIPQLGFNSYTFTDISPAFFEKARQEFTAHEDRMEFQKLDISQSPEAQGFKAHSYDLVLASSVLHATPNLDETMKNVRYLLRPGGYAVILEATHKDHTRVGYLFGLFPDWWAGRDEGRVLDPFATIDEWDAIFKRNGFSGVECRTLDRDGHIFPNSLFTTRAVTPKVTRLYEPLAVALQLSASAPLVVVGGRNSKSSRILEAVSTILPHRNPLKIDSLKDIRNKTFENKPTFLVLSELDEELFSDIDEPKLESVKSMFAQASNVLWITENAWSANPHQAMTIGFLRTVRNEYPELSVQALDVDNANNIDATTLCEQLLRLEEWSSPSSPNEDVLWTYEPEIYMCKGCLLVPRVKHDIPRNERMASGRRKIYSHVMAERIPVSLRLPDKDLQIESTRDTLSDVQPGHLVVVAQYSLMNALGAKRILAALEDVACQALQDTSISESSVVDLMSLELAMKKGIDLLTVINWKTDGPVAARIRPIDQGNLFRKNKTYLLVGLAGSTGRALSRWMVTKGARYVVLSSRNPQNPESKWVKKIEKLGGHITVLPMDISKKASVDAGLAQLREKLPPIGGIVYGPLVLHDTVLRNMDISMMHPVLNAKVTGAKLLHERFSSPVDNPLDFFVMCSSAATTGGNPGQANYNAANAFLLAFAQKRRLMGLAASAIHIGAVMGIGYLATREEKFDLQSVSDMDPLGEVEFCTLVAEAVVSGRPSSTPRNGDTDLVKMSEIDIGTGIPELHLRYKDTLVFYTDPRFGNLKVPEKRETTHSSSKTSVKEKLLVATTLDEVRQAIIVGLCDRLRGTLHLADGEQIDPDSPLIDQGVDSLGAITVASWFSNQLTLDVPILKVLGGASVAQLAEEAASRLPPSAMPQVAGVADHATDNDSVQSDNISKSGSGTDTPISIPTSNDEDPTVVRCAPLSLIQQNTWRIQQQLADDPTIFHNTVGLFLEGTLDLEKLSRAVLASFNRHEVFRTAIRCSEQGGEAVQMVLKSPTTSFRSVEVVDQNAAESALTQLRAEKYDLDAGEALKVVDFHWATDRHLFVIAYHRLTGDGSTTDNFFVELARLYDGAQLQLPPQYADFAQHTATLRLSSAIAQRIKEAARRLKATPMHFYLAAYKALLAALAGQDDLVVGLADTNRSSIDDMSTMGFFANMLPIRMNQPSDTTFEEVVSETKDHVRKAMLHSAVPYGLLLEELGLAGPDALPTRQMTHEPLVQAVFDYRQGERADSGKLGEATIVKVIVTRELFGRLCLVHAFVLCQRDVTLQSPGGRGFQRSEQGSRSLGQSMTLQSLIKANVDIALALDDLPDGKIVGLEDATSNYDGIAEETCLAWVVD